MHVMSENSAGWVGCFWLNENYFTGCVTLKRGFVGVKV